MEYDKYPTARANATFVTTFPRAKRPPGTHERVLFVSELVARLLWKGFVLGANRENVNSVTCFGLARQLMLLLFLLLVVVLISLKGIRTPQRTSLTRDALETTSQSSSPSFIRHSCYLYAVVHTCHTHGVGATVFSRDFWVRETERDGSLDQSRHSAYLEYGPNRRTNCWVLSSPGNNRRSLLLSSVNHLLCCCCWCSGMRLSPLGTLGSRVLGNKRLFVPVGNQMDGHGEFISRPANMSSLSTRLVFGLGAFSACNVDDMVHT